MNVIEQDLLKRLEGGKNLPNAVLDLVGLEASQSLWQVPDYSPLVDAISSVALQRGVDLSDVWAYIHQVEAAGDPAAISLIQGLK